jgi:hypothetical protein
MCIPAKKNNRKVMYHAASHPPVRRHQNKESNKSKKMVA